MSSVQSLREFVTERLTAAAAEIFGVFEKTIVEYEEEIDRQRKLLDMVWKPEIKLHRLELPQQEEEEEEVLTENFSLDQEEPEPPQMKEEQEELCTSQEGEQLVLKQETDDVVWIPVHEGRDQQLLCHGSSVAESQDQGGNKHVAAGLTGNIQPKKRRHKNTSRCCNVENSCEKNIYTHNHTEEKPHVCNICRRSFNYASNLKMHVRIHTGEKPYACKTCGRAFRLNNNLKIHIRRAHTGERPYLCNTCGKRFTESNELVKHERVHSGERPYVCNICGKTFKQTSALSCHLKIHRGGKRYFCNSQVNQSATLENDSSKGAECVKNVLNTLPERRIFTN